MPDAFTSDLDIAHQATSFASISGGVSLSGSATIGGDVVGRDKITVGYTAEQVSTLLTQISSTFQPKPFDGRCPYLGLDAFSEDDADRFFGRETLVNELVARVKESRFVVVAGPSGSGKSSLVRAGLIHALKQGALPNSDRWLYATLTPGRDPIESLALAMARMAKSPDAGDYVRGHQTEVDALHKFAESVLSDRKDQRAVIFVDQFEEVFTQVSKEDERAAFLNLLTRAATIENGRVIVLFALRADFVSNCATYPQLNALLNQQFMQVGAMQSDELVSAIARPALQVGLQIDPDLVAQIVNDMQDKPGALPLMQFALKDLFDAQQATGGVIALTLNDYLARGGLRKALERHADAAFARLNENEQQLARTIFSGLIEIGRGTQDTRRTATLEELVPANVDAAQVQAVVQKLADARLITTDEQADQDTVTISHERLIGAWPWLQRLVNENREAIALQNQIAEDAQEWDEHQRDASYLYGGARLATAREQLADQKIVLSGLAQSFVNAGVEVEEAKRRMEEARHQKAVDDERRLAESEKQRADDQTRVAARLRRWAVYLAGALGLALVAVAMAIILGVQAHQQAQIAFSRQLAAQANAHLIDQPDLALLLGVEANRTDNTVESQSSLLAALQANPRLIGLAHRQTDGVASTAFSSNSHWLAQGRLDGTIEIWDLAAHRPMGESLIGHTKTVLSLAFSPDGTLLASGSADHTVRLWDTATGQPHGRPLIGHTAEVFSVAFNADGSLLASGSGDHKIIVWSLADQRQVGQPLIGHKQSVFNVTFSPDGKLLASGSGDNTLILWNVTTQQPIGQPLIGHAAWVWSVAFSPDGATLASGSWDKTIRLWNVATHQLRGEPLIGHTLEVLSVTFSPDGGTLASSGNDRNIRLWDIATGKSLGEPITGHTTGVRKVAFDSAGQTLLSAATDGTVALWAVTPDQPLAQTLTANAAPLNCMASSPDGATLAAGAGYGTITVWNTHTRQLSGVIQTGSDEKVISVSFSPDGRTLASGSGDGSIMLWDVLTLRPRDVFIAGHTDRALSIAFSPDGKLLASGGDDRRVMLWDVATGQRMGAPLTDHTDSVYSVAFSSNGKLLASGSGDHTVILWDVATRQRMGDPLRGHKNKISTVAFSPDGKVLATAGDDSTIILWDVATRQQLGEPLTGLGNILAFSPDGQTLASGGANKTITLWNLRTRQQLGKSFTGHTDWITGIAFDPLGKVLVSSSMDGSLKLWDIDPVSWQVRACQLAGRNFTQNEWDQYYPDQSYRKTCDQWPASE